MIALRREPFDFGILPASFLLPRAESVAALAPIRRRLLQCAHPSRHDPTKLVVSVTDAAQCMGIAPQHAEHVIDTMHAVAPAEPAPHPAEDDGLPNEPEVRVQHLMQFLFVQTFARPHAQSSLRENGSGLELTHGFHAESGAGDGRDETGGGINGTLGTHGGAYPSPPRGVSSPHGSPAKRARSANNGAAHVERDRREDQLREAFAVHHFNALAGLLVEDESRTNNADGGGGGGGGGSIVGPGGHGGGIVQLTASEVDALDFMFREVPPDGERGSIDDAADAVDAAVATDGGRRVGRLSASTGLFEDESGRDGLVPSTAVRDWIARALAPVERSSDPGSPGGSPHRSTGGSSSGTHAPPSGDPGFGTIEIGGLHRGTRVVREGDAGSSSSVAVRNCVDSVVYLLAPFQYATVANCVDCVVVVGACARALRAEQCERLTVIAASKRFIAKMCHECAFHLGVERRPAFLGENRGCHVAPYNTFYEQLERHLESAGLEAGRCARWDSPVVLGGGGGGEDLTDRLGGGVDKLPAEKFSPFIVPFRGQNPNASSSAGGQGQRPPTQANPFAVPPEYVRALDAKVKVVASLRSALRDAGLDERSRRELQATIQAFFKEWLMTSGSMRQVYDLARIERGEEC